MRYKSKIDWWFHLTVLFVLAMTALPFVIGFQRGFVPAILVSGGILLLADLLLIFPCYLFTFYALEETALQIRCGFFMSERIAYEEITAMSETRDPLASAGLSLDRISIKHTKGEVLISPANKQGFMRDLAQRCSRLSDKA